MPSIGIPELLIVLVIIVVIFGVGRLPEIGGAIGKSIREFKSSVNTEDDETAESQAKSEITGEVSGESNNTSGA